MRSRRSGESVRAIGLSEGESAFKVFNAAKEFLNLSRIGPSQ